MLRKVAIHEVCISLIEHEPLLLDAVWPLPANPHLRTLLLLKDSGLYLRNRLCILDQRFRVERHLSGLRPIPTFMFDSAPEST
jgi:hypothetical protein